MQTIYLDISNKGVIPTIYAKQGDVGRKFLVVLTDSGIPYVPPAGSVFSAWYEGDSGEGNYTDIGEKSAFSVSENKVAVEMISQMLSNDGDGVLSLVLNDPNGNQISTWNIPYICEYVPGADSEEAKAYYTAFSQAVKNLPYPDASLSVPGKAADAAATGKALEGKAPAGYGLGEAVSRAWSEVDSIISPGWYRFSGLPFDAFQYANMRVDAWDLNNLRQTMYPLMGTNAEMRREKINGVWQEWEWVDPPMALGVEYRTTERIEGSPVFVKLINFGALPNTTSRKAEAVVDAGCSLVGVGGHVYNRSNQNTIPAAGQNFISSVQLIKASGDLEVTTTSDTSGWDFYPVLKYIKR